MGIAYIKIENFKSIKKIEMNILDINALVGGNGSGKSNIISAIKFYYDNLNESKNTGDFDIFDKNNKYNNEARITVGYNLDKLKRQCYENTKKSQTPKYSKYYENIISLSEMNIIEVTVVVLKNKRIVWNIPFSKRKLIYNLYPIYTIDTRRIDLIDWENLWLQVGDLGKLEKKDEKEFKESFKEILMKYNKTFKIYNEVNNLFEENNIKIKKYSPKQMASIVAKLFFDGNEFEFNENKLTFFSDGTNSYNYIKIYIQILSMLSEKKMKEPILVLDEPEIGLHHNYVDLLFETIFSNCANIDFIISTHSSRMIKNLLIKMSSNSRIYHVKLLNNYTNIMKMEMFKDIRESSRITDQHANAYFSQMVVCVEGATELELLQNPFLKLLYPILNKIDVMPGMAEEVERKIISPNERKYSVPIIYTIDMDKVLGFSKEKRKLVLIRNKFENSDKYAYTQRRMDTIATKKRINAMVDKCKFRYKMPIFFSNDKNLIELKEIIKKYYLEYDYYVMDTTIEGALINKVNLEKFIEFIIETKVVTEQKLLEIGNLTEQLYDQEKLNIYRLLCEGKCDLIMGIKELKKNNPSQSAETKRKYSVLSEPIEKKTNGWVSHWIEYFLCKELGIEPFHENSYNKVKSFLGTDIENSIKNKFALNFQELDDWFCEIDKRYGKT